MRSTSAPKPNGPDLPSTLSSEETGVVQCPGQAVLISECLWNRRAFCMGAPSCCIIEDGDILSPDDPYFDAP